MKPKNVIDLNAVATAWRTLQDQLGQLSLAFSHENASHIGDVVDTLLDATSEDDGPSDLNGLLSALSDWLMEYEKVAHPLPGATPAELLRHLMEENGLRQDDLANVLGGQSVVSAILNGHRQINAGQAAKLGQRFKLSSSAFIADPPTRHEAIMSLFVKLANDTRVDAGASLTNFENIWSTWADEHTRGFLSDESAITTGANRKKLVFVELEDPALISAGLLDTLNQGWTLPRGSDDPIAHQPVHSTHH